MEEEGCEDVDEGFVDLNVGGVVFFVQEICGPTFLYVQNWALNVTLWGK